MFIVLSFGASHGCFRSRRVSLFNFAVNFETKKKSEDFVFTLFLAETI